MGFFLDNCAGRDIMKPEAETGIIHEKYLQEGR